jgi:hypothetical protein
MKAMSDQKPKGLGQQLMDAMEKTLALQKATNDPAQRKELSAVRKKLSAEAGRLIDAALDAATEEYKAAAEGLEEACDLADKGIQDVNSVRDAIVALTQAADFVSKVAVV